MQTEIYDNTTRYPRMGTDDDLFCRLTEYISLFDKGWIDRIKPASKEQIFELKEISKLEERYKLELPKSYEIFLSTMGSNDGGLLSNAHSGNSDVESIIEIYKEFHQFSPYNNPNVGHCFSFFVGFEQQFSFDFSRKHSENVVKTDWGEFICVESENFEKFLFQAAFFRFELYTFSECFTSSSDDIKAKTQRIDMEDIFEVVLEIADSIAKEYGLKKAWFSDFNTYIALGCNCSFRIQRWNEEGAAYGSVSGDNQEVVKSILNILIAKLGFRST